MVGHHDEWWSLRIVGEIGEGPHELLPPSEVESGRWFVEQHHRRVVHERASEQHPLLLSRRERAEPARRQASDAEPIETLVGALVVGGLVAVPPGFECGEACGLHDVVSGEVPPELVGERRRGVPDPPTQLAHVGRAQSLTEDLDRSGRRMVVQRHHPHHRGLARPVRPEDHPAFARIDAQ